jgi:tol-pal system protein YbgF
MRPKTFFCVLLISLLSALSTATAGTKEEILRLQSDVLQLQNQIRDFEKAFNEKTDGLKSLVIQLNDQVAKSNLYLEKVSKALETQASGSQNVNQSMLQEIRALSGKIDDMGTRISAMAQQIADLKLQSKALPQGESSPPGAPSPNSVYDQSYIDFVQGNFDLAIQGFSSYLSTNPQGDKASISLLYLGDAYSSQGKLPEAITAFSRVISDYPNSEQVAGALFKRGRAELSMRESDNAIADFRAIIDKFPTAPEAERAKDELRRLGVNPKPVPAKEQPRRKSR